MNKFIFVICFTCILFSCRTNTNSNTEKPSSTTLENIIKTRKMNVGYLEFPPCVMRDKSTNQLSGIFVDMVNQMARSIDTNIQVKWVETSLANFTADLKTNKFDFCVGPTFVNIPRSTAVYFSNPVCYVGNAGAVRKGTSSKYNTLEKLNSPDVRITVLKGQAMETFCKTFLPKADISAVEGGLTSPLQAVSSGRSDIGFMNVSTTANFVKEHNELEMVSINNDKLEVLPLSWTTRISDQTLMNFINSSILYFESTGRIADYQKKYDIKLLYKANNLEVAK